MLGMLATGAVSAADDSTAFTAGVALSANRFDYREFDGAGRELDRETATLPGVTLTVGGPLADFFWHAEITLQKGSARYAGRTNLNTPHNTTTRERVLDGSAHIGRWFNASGLPPFALYAGIGRREWDRDIGATPTVGGLFETYTWGYGFLGAKAIVFKREALQWTADVRLLRPFDPKVTIDFKGAFSATPQVEPAARTGIRIALPLRYAMQDGSAFSLEPYFEQWNLGRSENVSFRSGALTLSVHEPASETRSFGVRFGWNKSF